MSWFSKTSSAPPAPAVELCCSFCGESQRRVGKLIAGPTVYICDRCVRLCVDIIEGKQLAPAGIAIPQSIPEFKALLDHFERHCVGHDRARRVLSAALVQHIARLQPDSRAERPPVVLLAGPHGCGKTTLARALLGASTLPGLLADVNRLSAVGYVGLDVENLLHELLRTANGAREVAQAGVLVLDGLHRLALRAPPPGAPRDITGESVQRELLRVLDGLETDVYGAGPRHPAQQSEPFSCSRLLVVLVGSFEGLSADEATAREELAGRGLLRELLSRVDLVLPMPALSPAELSEVFLRPEHGLLPRQLASLAAAGIVVEMGEGSAQAMIERALPVSDGAWALRRPLARLAEEALAQGGPLRIQAEDVLSW